MILVFFPKESIVYTAPAPPLRPPGPLLSVHAPSPCTQPRGPPAGKDVAVPKPRPSSPQKAPPTSVAGRGQRRSGRARGRGLSPWWRLVAGLPPSTDPGTVQRLKKEFYYLSRPMSTGQWFISAPPTRNLIPSTAYSEKDSYFRSL